MKTHQGPVFVKDDEAGLEQREAAEAVPGLRHRGRQLGLGLGRGHVPALERSPAVRLVRGGGCAERGETSSGACSLLSIEQ